MSLSSAISVSNQCLVWSRGRGGTGQVKLQFPMEPHWYNEQPCTTFLSLQHRKEFSGFRHEFIVLEFINGSICRIERMGDPDAPLYSLSSKGTLAHDVAQYFLKEDIEDARLDTSEIVSQISFPYAVDLKDVLYICRAIHEAESTHNYTLRGFNCYFFATTIQTCLARRLAEWERIPAALLWPELDTISLNRLRPIWTQKSFTLLYLATRSQTQEWEIDQIHEEFVKVLRQLLLGPELKARIKHAMYSELWHTRLDSILPIFIEQAAEEAMALAFSTRLEAFVTTCHDEESRFRGEIVLSWLRMFTDGPGLYTQTALIDQSLILPKDFDDPWLKQLGYHPPRSLSKPDPRPHFTQLTLAQWWIILCVWANLRNTLWWLWLIILDILSIWGVELLTKSSPKPCVVIEKEIEEILSSWDPEVPSSTGDFSARLECLFKKCNEGTAFWEVTPWNDAAKVLKSSLQCCALFPKDKVPCDPTSRNEWRLGENKFIISFQDHILARIESHAKLVDSVLLGSATEIRTQLEHKMTEIWRLIRNQNDGDPQFARSVFDRLFRDQYLGMVSEWIEKGNLHEYLRKYPGVDRYQLCVQVASGLNYMHSLDCVHGNLKATNVLVSSDGVAKLSGYFLDFSGVTSSLVLSESSNWRWRSLRWMAPELLSEEPNKSKQSDVYALGMTMLEIFTGEVPYARYRNDCTCAVSMAVIRGILPTRPLDQLKDDEQGNMMWQLLLDCWSPNSSERPSSRQVLAKLRFLCQRRD
ncbi:tyrosine kinase catalytic domain protein [Rhizoctonia solani 123E]|uniref:Tyrosine kinase catalytic domain protein n=1 Tax=Rhizoctonia solani 123E TaxID=1423351 RepID=A0A074S8A4_9AGAM|nr:tyrosine kinase catalytic domain protein [Rhizoctonia solani 123E]